MRSLPVGLLLLVLAILPSGRAAMADDEAGGNPHVAATLLAGTTGAATGTAVPLALRLMLAPGWHTYWTDPGDAGMPPEVTVSQDGGAASPADLGFPPPRRIDEGGLVGFGYTGTVLLPFRVVPRAGAGPLRLAVHAAVLVCSTVCVPAEVSPTLSLPRVAGTPVPSADASAVDAAFAAVPRLLPSVRATVDGTGTLRVSGLATGPIRGAGFFPDGAGLIDIDRVPPVRRDGDTLVLGLRPLPPLRTASRLGGVLVLTGDDGRETALRIDAARGAAPDTPATPPRPALLLLVALAFAGGAVLNLMPCVFPILAMKALALARAANAADRAAGRRSAIRYASGTIGSLVALGAVLIALRLGGAGVAWGFQLQSAPVVGLTALLLFGVGLNLLGVFAVGAGRLAGAGQATVARGGALSDLLAGALAVLVATPCTAPFMGAALAGALAGPPAGALLVFASLGAGLASPMLLLGLMPGLSRLLPRPGAWMQTFQRLLAWPMFASVLWLVWVISVEAGPAGVLRIGAALLLLAFAPFLLSAIRDRAVARGAAAIAALLALLLLPTLRADGGAGGAAGAASVPGAEPFTPDRLAALVAAKRKVLVDMSAAWCLTCLVNERVALVPAGPALRRDGVVVLRGDWTGQDPGITAFLRRFHREGVPLVVFFPPGGTPRVLPQILTSGEIEAAVGERPS